jgi:DNA end-binding protein Ku
VPGLASMPASLWSGNLRLSLVLIPVKLHAAISTEDAISFRMIHEPSGKPIRYVMGIPTEQGFEEVPEDEIVKGYEHAKGHHVLIKPEEIDDLKLEAKHTIDMVRFVDEAEIDTRYLEKPYYLTPDGDDADEGYTVIRDALKQTGKALRDHADRARFNVGDDKVWLPAPDTMKDFEPPAEFAGKESH